MITNHNSTLIIKLFILITTLFLYSGCAKIPWTNQLATEEIQPYLSTINSIQQQWNHCSNDWDADVNISWSTALGTSAFSGYLQVSEPSSFKFIVSNPLGQPLLAITSNGEKYQFLDILREQYTHGSTLSYALRNNIPVEFASGSWGDWLIGRISAQVTENPAISHDKKGRGLWLTMESSIEDGKDTTNHYLLDLEKMTVQEQRVFDTNTKHLANITYESYKLVGSCMQPHLISMSSLPFGATIQITLTNIQSLGIATEKDFTLPIPQHYFIKHLP